MNVRNAIAAAMGSRPRPKMLTRKEYTIKVEQYRNKDQKIPPDYRGYK